MPEDNRPPTNGDAASAVTGTAVGVPIGGGILASVMPAGLFSIPLGEADASDEFAQLAPTFGDVLLSVGTGVASSQAALDEGLVATAKALSGTKIKVVTDVIQKLNDDGLPVVADTELITQEVSAINFVSPQVHEWKHVALSMDLEVGEMSVERGMTFSRQQSYSKTYAYGLFWGFVGWSHFDDGRTSANASTNTLQESDWASGQVRLDAMLGPRRTEKFPVPAEVSVGPQIYFSQGSVVEVVAGGVVTSRTLEILIKVRKADGSANSGINLGVDVDRFAFSFVSAGDFNGSTTNADGEVKVKVTRDIPNPAFNQAARAKVTAELGQIRKQLDIIL